MKKILILLLVMVLVIVLIPCVAFAADVDTGGGEPDFGNVNTGVIAVVVFMAVFVELILERIKSIYEKKPPAWVNNILAVLIGIGLCFLFGVDMLGAFGLHSPYIAGAYVGMIATGLCVGGGSGFIHAALDRLRAGKVLPEGVALIGETEHTESPPEQKNIEE